MQIPTRDKYIYATRFRLVIRSESRYMLMDIGAGPQRQVQYKVDVEGNIIPS